MGHIHSGGLAVMPNGDLLQVSFSSGKSESEDSPDTTMVVTRLRRGSDEWDMPDLFYDLADLIRCSSVPRALRSASISLTVAMYTAASMSSAYVTGRGNRDPERIIA